MNKIFRDIRTKRRNWTYAINDINRGKSMRFLLVVFIWVWSTAMLIGFNMNKSLLENVIACFVWTLFLAGVIYLPKLVDKLIRNSKFIIKTNSPPPARKTETLQIVKRARIQQLHSLPPLRLKWYQRLWNVPNNVWRTVKKHRS